MARISSHMNVDEVDDGEKKRVVLILGLAILMTTAAELFYLVVWGMWLFPAGSWVGKAVWTLTCGLGMGAVIGTLTLLWAEPRRSTAAALWIAPIAVVSVGSYCAWLCSMIDARFSYFGGSENRVLFIAGGVGPAAVGGTLYGWLIYGQKHPRKTRDAE